MKNCRLLCILCLLCALCGRVWGGVVFYLTQYDEEDGVPSGHVTQLLQDGQGFMWFSTWNGLCRYDGYEFHTFKPEAGDGCQMVTDRIRNIGLRPDGKILCRVDEDYFLFDPQTCRFYDNDSSESPEDDIKRFRQSQSLKNGNPIEWEDSYHTRWTFFPDGRLASQTQEGQTTEHSLGIKASDVSFACPDGQGNLWVLISNTIYKITTGKQHTQQLDINPPAEVKCLFKDGQGRCWVTTKDGVVRVYSTDDCSLVGYLGTDGRLHQGYTHFGAPVYSMYQSADGTLWLGTKPDGLFRLKDDGIEQFTDLPNTNIYNMVEDSYGRLWVATLGGGLCYKDQHFKVPKNYPKDHAQRVRFLHIAHDNILMAATTEGVLVAELKADADDMQFRLHQREPERTTSLSSSAIMDIMETADGRIFVSTESGGINQIESLDLLGDQLQFRHYNTVSHHLPNDLALSSTPMVGNRIMVVSGHVVSLLDSTGHSRVLDSRFFHADYRFSEAHPQQLGGGRWLFGLTDGAFITTTEQMCRHASTPRLVLTSISLQGDSSNWAAEYLDTLTLQPHERNMTVHFAALNYMAPDRINFAFRLTPAGRSTDTFWNHIGHNRSVTLLDLEPGTYHLDIRSTNADGEWTDNIRTLTLIVKPAFWESVWGRLLIVFLIVSVIGMVVYTLLYIRRIKRKQHETLEAYLALIESNAEGEATVTEQEEAPSKELSEQDQAFMDRVVRYVEEHIGDADANTDGMAEAAAASRSVLFRKMKNIVGLTPADFLREARIKRACQLLTTTQNTVADVAYSCGFSDPKYFSKCFKSSTGCSPKEYRSAKEG